MVSPDRIIWTDSLSVNNLEIDHQHKKLIQLINDLIDKDELGPIPQESFESILTKLTDYSLQHFKDEEAYLKEIRYPGLSDQINKHEEFILKIALFNFDYLNKNPSVQNETVIFLKDWLLNHVTREDMKYRDYLFGLNT